MMSIQLTTRPIFHDPNMVLLHVHARLGSPYFWLLVCFHHNILFIGSLGVHDFAFHVQIEDDELNLLGEVYLHRKVYKYCD